MQLNVIFQSQESFLTLTIPYLNAEILPRTMGPIKNLAILFDSKLKSDGHINNIFSTSNKILGFIYLGDFTDKDAFRSIYCSLVRSICEYGSFIIWSPYQTSYKLKLEKIQQKLLLRFIFFKCSLPREPHSSYSPLLAIMNLETLEQRRMRLYIYFTIFVGNIDCLVFSSRFSFHVPTRSTRTINTF